MSEDSAKAVFTAVPKIARALKAAYEPIGINVLNNNGKDAGQSVFHFHAHLIPRYGKGDGFGAVWHDHSSEYSNDDLQQIAREVSTKIY